MDGFLQVKHFWFFGDVLVLLNLGVIQNIVDKVVYEFSSLVDLLASLIEAREYLLQVAMIFRETRVVSLKAEKDILERHGSVGLGRFQRLHHH